MKTVVRAEKESRSRTLAASVQPAGIPAPGDRAGTCGSPGREVRHRQTMGYRVKATDLCQHLAVGARSGGLDNVQAPVSSHAGQTCR